MVPAVSIYIMENLPDEDGLVCRTLSVDACHAYSERGTFFNVTAVDYRRQLVILCVMHTLENESSVLWQKLLLYVKSKYPKTFSRKFDLVHDGMKGLNEAMNAMNIENTITFDLIHYWIFFFF